MTKNWSARVSDNSAYRRAGLRRRHNKLQHLEKIQRQNELIQICLTLNFPFSSTTREVRKKYIEFKQKIMPNYYISHYTIVYDLQNIFGKNYVQFYYSLKRAGLFEYPEDILLRLNSFYIESIKKI